MIEYIINTEIQKSLIIDINDLIELVNILVSIYGNKFQIINLNF